MGFGVPVGAWFRKDLRNYVQDLLLTQNALSRDYLLPAYVETLVREHVEGKHNHANRLWAILAFEVWLRLVREKSWRQARDPLAFGC